MKLFLHDNLVGEGTSKALIKAQLLVCDVCCLFCCEERSQCMDFLMLLV